MNMIKEMKERHSLEKLIMFEGLYAHIEQVAKDENDPRIDKEGGVSDQLQAIRDAIYELRIEKGIPVPNIVINAQTIVLGSKCNTQGASYG